MYADFKGTADIVYKDRLLILLIDTLYVPRLRVNLLLARRIY